MVETPRRIALTGASRGLGRAMVEGFIQRGHTVCGCARNAEALAALSRQFGSLHRFDVVDVSDDQQVQAWARQVLADGVPDLLINNAAVINVNAPLWEVSAADFDQVIDVNVKGTVNVIRHFLPAMIERGSGVVVNFSSGWGRSTSPEVAPYCATKFAIEGLTKALAQELPDGLAAIPLNPGVIDTDMLRSCFGGGADAYPRPEQWAERAVPVLLGFAAADNGISANVA